MREVRAAGKKPQVSAPLLCDVIADGAAKHWKIIFERVKNSTQGNRSRDINLHLAAHLCEIPQVIRKFYADRCRRYHNADALLNAAIELLQTTPAEGLLQWAPNCRPHRQTRTPGRPWYRNIRRTGLTCRRPLRRVTR